MKNKEIYNNIYAIKLEQCVALALPGPDRSEQGEVSKRERDW